MSLMRLLTATRSISDVKNEPSPYRMSQQGVLPKFGPRKAKENLGEGHGDRKDAGCSLKLESSREPKGSPSWWQKWFRRKPRREAREPVQAEFALDLVKVVRNDLSDAGETRSAKRETRKEDKLKLEHQQESVFGASRG
jgi:hypothetical protein